MTARVKEALEKISNNEIFNGELYFTGGTTLAYYFNHRISDDVYIVFSKTLNYKLIIPSISILGASKIKDENVAALRMARLFPDNYFFKSCFTWLLQ
ncbi:hypothetical protein GJV85_13390 (plasmid) [Sulfurimonas aquatica]|uniref:Uncharacterized protein n=1 Tax=Sulfurimonas aquatica TaxID=2672570 RepID=A0A975GE65_9BACT|nr:hypothetical protein [Sulfurimonas aquatica]QSZ43164.1 hypothetical protein GJV85_13390 [Sulfurimonas aquatica]